MKKSLFIILVLLLGAASAHFLLQDRGIVIINFRGHELTMSVPMLVLLYCLLYMATRLLIRSLRSWRFFWDAVDRQTVKRARNKLTRGLMDISEGNYTRGEKLLAQGARASETPLLNYLGAARAAQNQGAHERRDNWLMLAYEKAPEASSAILLTQAELQIGHQQYEEALATLRKLDEISPKHAQGQHLMADIYRELGDWESLRDLLPALRKRKTRQAAELDELSGEVHARLIEEAGASGETVKVEAAWKAVPRAVKAKPPLGELYGKALLACGEDAAAELFLRKSIASQWDDDLVALYGLVEAPDKSKQLSRAENWLKTRGDNPKLLLAAARLAMRNELWGKARSYAESCLSISPSPEAYQVYGQLLDQIGESGAATRALNSGLNLLTGNKTELPKLESLPPK